MTQSTVQSPQGLPATISHMRIMVAVVIGTVFMAAMAAVSSYLYPHAERTWGVAGIILIGWTEFLSFALPCFITTLLVTRNAKEGVVAGAMINLFGFVLFDYLSVNYISPSAYTYAKLGLIISIGFILAIVSAAGGALFGAAGGVLGSFWRKRRNRSTQTNQHQRTT